MQSYGCSPHRAESIYPFELSSSYPGLAYGIGSQKCFLQPAISPKEPVPVCLLMARCYKGTQWTTDLDQASPRIQKLPTHLWQKSIRGVSGSLGPLGFSQGFKELVSLGPIGGLYSTSLVFCSSLEHICLFLLVFSRYHGEKNRRWGTFPVTRDTRIPFVVRVFRSKSSLSRILLLSGFGQP